MSVVDRCSELWIAATPAERRAVLRRFPPPQDGRSVEMLSFVDDPDLLPPSVFERLILATTDYGFSTEEYEEAVARLLEFGSLREYEG